MTTTTGRHPIFMAEKYLEGSTSPVDKLALTHVKKRKRSEDPLPNSQLTPSYWISLKVEVPSKDGEDFETRDPALALSRCVGSSASSSPQTAPNRS